MLNKRLYWLFALIIIVATVLPASVVQARSINQDDKINCPAYNPKMADNVAFLSQLPPECRSAYYKNGIGGEQSRSKTLPQFVSSMDSYGYYWDDSITTTWIDTSGGTDTGLSGYGGGTGPIALPFSFKYYDNIYDNVYITSYGYLAFDYSTWWSQDEIPSPFEPNNVIAPYWTPTYIPAGSWVHYQSGGTAPNRYFVVEWHNLTGDPPGSGYLGEDDSYLFEVVLHENGNIDFIYAAMSINSSWWCGAAGIENSTGLDGLIYVDFCDWPPYSDAVRFYRPATGSFIDVTVNYWAQSYIERLYNAGITGGCVITPLKYCPETTVTRDQMAVFLLRGIHGSAYNPPAVGASTGFGDVPTNYWSAAWIKQLAAENITGGCGSGDYCPTYPVTRDQMAVFLLRSKYGSAYSPPAVGASTGFGDVPTNHWAAAWIKQLVAEGITSGCGSGNYCPDIPVSRAQMAVFLVRTFSLP